MKTLQIFLVLLVGMFIFNACQKEALVSPSSTVSTTPQKMTDLKVKSTFDWKTVKTYQFTLTGNVTDLVSIVSSDGSIYHKALLSAQTAYKITLSLPSYETKVHLLYNEKDIEFPLNSTTVNYTFK
ncbi:MAG: hypothetical protein HXX14_05620 [Bacteroidetes bacterium]|nr:hypothetical protein [Bacteroidota bacterium]